MIDELTHARELYADRAWSDAYAALSLVDRTASLAVEDLERLAVAAYLIGRDDRFLNALERAHQAYLGANDPGRAARCAFWLGFQLLLQGEAGPGTGWLGRAQRLLATGNLDCVEHGYLHLPAAEQSLSTGDCGAAYAAAASAADIGARFGDADLVACARHVQGRALIEQGEVEAGLSLLDEAMVAVTANELSPLFTGLIYCSVIDACQRVYALGRAREWTSAMTAWCAGQPQMIAFSGTCLVHRAEVLRLHGAWDDALDEVRSAGERFTRGGSQKPPAAAYYQQGELCRLRGEFEAAEDFYRRASLSGLEPQPGLSLLRVAQGKPDVALAAMRRVLATVSDRLQRMRLLPAEVEIALIVGKLDAARGACDELERIAESFATDVSSAIAAQARGAVSLAGKDVQAASHSLRRAAELWERVKAPYEVACVRVLLARAFRVLGDDEGMRLELDAARAVFQQLGALPDLARVDALGHDPEPVAAHGLSRRELQVLRLVAAGKSNKGIARELGLSEKTVERHLSNIFAKLDVASRAGATAYAYEHQLVEKRPSAP